MTRQGLRKRPIPPIRPVPFPDIQGFAIMAIEHTFSIIKPDATRRNLTGKINAVFEEAGLRIVAQKRIHMSPAQAESFYGVHRERPPAPWWSRCWKARTRSPATAN
jgi:hypothetical protein